MVNRIILYILLTILCLSIILVIFEPLLSKNSFFGRFFRFFRIRLREKSRTSFCFTSIMILLFSLITHDTNYKMMFCAIGIMFVTLFVLRPMDILSVFRIRKRPKRKIDLLRKTKSKDAVLLTEMTPLEIKTESE